MRMRKLISIKRIIIIVYTLRRVIINVNGLELLEVKNKETVVDSVDGERETYYERPIDHHIHVGRSVLRDNSDFNNQDEEDDIKTLLEEKYKFKNDETSTRFKISNDEKKFPGKT
jgi:hypothetical protein